MFKVLVPAVAALGLVAFAAQSRVSVADQDLDTSVMSWSIHHEGALAKLAYGVPYSDQLALMITCMPGDATAYVYGDVQIEGARLMQASLTLDPLSAGDADESEIALSNPALADAGRFQLIADREERRIVSDFLSYCLPGHA
jgi:hypothetical protein